MAEVKMAPALGAPQRSFHRQLLASKAFEALPKADRRALGALSKKDRRVLSDLWEPEGAAFGLHLFTLEGNPVFDLQRALHGFSYTEPIAGEEPDEAGFVKVNYEKWEGIDDSVRLQLSIDDEALIITAFKDAHNSVAIGGFDRNGELGERKAQAVVRHGNDLSEKTFSAWDAKEVAQFIADALAGGK